MSTLITTNIQGVQNIKYDASTTAMTIDSGGRINQPTLPRLFVGHTTNGGVAYSVGNQYVDSSTVVHNITAVGITFDGSNGRFTLPVAGDYYVHYFNMAYGDTGVVEWSIKLNGTIKYRAYHGMDGNRWVNFSCSGIITATAGQYLNCEVTGAGATYEGHGGTYSGFSVHLLG